MDHTRITDRRLQSDQDREDDRRRRGAIASSTVERLHRRLGNRAVRALAEQGQLQSNRQLRMEDDATERDAERTARQAVRMDRRDSSMRDEPMESTTGSAASDTRSSARSARDGPVARRGEPLADRVRARFEPRFDADFEDVRVHRDARAAELAAGLGARAFTVDRDIVFGSGEYDPNSRTGRTLLAHELAHVVQQRDGSPALQRQALTEGQRRSEEPAYTDAVSTPILSLRTAEAYLLASPIGSYVEERLAVEETGDGYRCLDEPQLYLLDEDAFEAAWIEYAVGAPHPDTDEPFTRETAAAFLEDNVRAFQSGQRTVVRFERSLPGITIHEVLHRLAGYWPSEQGHNVNEGITEYFTRLVIEGRDIPYDSEYGQQAAAIEQLVDVVGLDAVATAYFENSDYDIKVGFRDAGLRYTNFDRWLTAVKNGEYVVASMILEGHQVSPGHGPMTPGEE